MRFIELINDNPPNHSSAHLCGSIQSRSKGPPLVRGVEGPGRYEVIWDGRNARGESVGSGVYMYRLRIGSYDSVRKMVLVK